MSKRRISITDVLWTLAFLMLLLITWAPVALIICIGREIFEHD